MTLNTLQEICARLPGVTTDIKWENHYCFNVADKMFLIIGIDNIPMTASFKVREEDFDTLCDREGFEPAPYLARYRWVWIDDIKRMSRQEWTEHIRQSYELVTRKLPLKIKKDLALK